MYLKLKGKIPSRTEMVQLADTWPVKAFEPLVRCFIMYVCMCIHASLTFVYQNREICHYVVQLADDEYAEIGYTKSGFSFALNNLLPELHI